MGAPTYQLNVRVSPALYESVKAAASASNKSVTAIVNEAIQLYFNHDHEQGETNK